MKQKSQKKLKAGVIKLIKQIKDAHKATANSKLKFP